MFTRHTVKLDKQLYEQALGHAHQRGYATLEEYVNHLIEQDLRASEHSTTKDKVLEKMKGLGYIE